MFKQIIANVYHWRICISVHKSDHITQTYLFLISFVLSEIICQIVLISRSRL